MLVWLIDMGYVTKASKGRGKVDYIGTRKKLEQKYGAPCQPIIFNSVDAYGVDTGLSQFYFTVRKAGFTVNLYRMEGGAQKQVDVAIASHLVFHAMQKDQVILSSGDIDFLPAMQLVRRHVPEAQMYLLTFDFGVHQELIHISDEHLLFEHHPEMMRA